MESTPDKGVKERIWSGYVAMALTGLVTCFVTMSYLEITSTNTVASLCFPTLCFFASFLPIYWGMQIKNVRWPASLSKVLAAMSIGLNVLVLTPLFFLWVGVFLRLNPVRITPF